MISKITHAFQSLTQKLRRANAMSPVQAEFDFSTTSRPPVLLRLDLSSKSLSPMLDAINSCLASGTSDLRIELLGPGILLHDHALMLFEELNKRPEGVRLHVHSHTCLSDGAILLWLAGDTRSIRSDAWIQLSAMPPLPSLVEGFGGYDSAVQIDEEDPAATDLRTIMDHMDEWLPVHEVAGLRLFSENLEELGLLESDASRDLLNSIFTGTSTSTPENTTPATRQYPDTPASDALPADTPNRSRG